MKGLKLELQDGNFPLLQKVSMSVHEQEAFTDADYAVLLGSWPPKSDGIMEKNVMIFKTMGRALEEYAKKDCKVVIFGPPSSTNALVCSHYAPSLPKVNFTAVSRLQHNRALGQLAFRANVSPADVRKLIIWGGDSGKESNHAMPTGYFVDSEHCELLGKQVSKVLSSEEDRRWLAEELSEVVKNRGRDVIAARKASAAMSAARAVCDHVRSLHCGTKPGDFLCCGVWTDSQPYGIGPGLYVSVPVTCHGSGRFSIVTGLSLSKAVHEHLKRSEAELVADRDLAKELFLH
jgi:malate dehydrogenase